jgi:hypothetical protein
MKLDENLPDLEPRNHLYVTAGVTNLAATFAFNTLTQANGFHELTAVSYEGSHVRTQTRASQWVQVQNGPLSASFSILLGDTNTALEATLQFSIVANTNNVTRIELFSTGGALTNVTGQGSASFSVAGSNLGLGLHPFYAVVTASDGQKYRTETRWIRLVGGPDAPFPVAIAPNPTRLSWPGLAGRQYDILSTTNIAQAFVVQDSVLATNSLPQWTDTNTAAIQRFYRVRTSN